MALESLCLLFFFSFFFLSLCFFISCSRQSHLGLPSVSGTPPTPEAGHPMTTNPPPAPYSLGVSDPPGVRATSPGLTQPHPPTHPPLTISHLGSSLRLGSFKMSRSFPNVLGKSPTRILGHFCYCHMSFSFPLSDE